MTLALGIEWQLSFLAPVLSLSFLASPGPRLTLRQGIRFVSTVAVTCLAGFLLGKHLIALPLVYVPFTGLLLLRIFYMKASGRSPVLTTWILIAVLAIPLITMTSPQIAGLVAMGLLFSATVTVGVVWLSYGLLPDPRGTHVNEGNAAVAAATPTLPSSIERFHTAAVSTLVVLPVLILFYSLQMHDALLILIFVALLSSQPGFASNFKVGKALVIGNIMGGVAAIILYELLVLVPEFQFLIMMTLLSGLIFGSKVFSDKPTAKLYGMAFSTLLLVIASTTSSGSAEAESEVYTRVAQIIVAVVYVVMAFGVADRFMKKRGRAR